MNSYFFPFVVAIGFLLSCTAAQVYLSGLEEYMTTLLQTNNTSCPLQECNEEEEIYCNTDRVCCNGYCFEYPLAGESCTPCGQYYLLRQLSHIFDRCDPSCYCDEGICKLFNEDYCTCTSNKQCDKMESEDEVCVEGHCYGEIWKNGKIFTWHSFWSPWAFSMYSLRAMWYWVTLSEWILHRHTTCQSNLHTWPRVLWSKHLLYLFPTDQRICLHSPYSQRWTMYFW